MSRGQWQKGKITRDQEILTHDQALQIPSEQALNGFATAAVALERALRTSPQVEEEVEDEFAHILSKRK